VHPYALSKWLGEEVVMHLGSLYRIPTMSLRLFNVYGPRGRTGGLYGAVMGTFLAQRAHGAPLTIVGDGTQRRDFVWVEDVADAFVRAAAVDCIGICNIGSGEATSINRLAAMIGGPVVHIPARGGEPAITQADTRKAKRQLGWVARTSLVEGIAHLLKDLTPWTVAPWTPETIAEATAAWHRHLG
jgi:UDP-glucose 4-epimerase